jgi:FkbM family methyltransferase
MNSLLRAGIEIARQGARKAGIHVCKYPSPGDHLGQLVVYLERNAINVVLDVGAFTGDFASKVRRAGYRGRIISFEPVPGSFTQLEARLGRDLLWQGVPYGLSDEDRQAVINTYDLGDFNSLLNLHEDAEKVYALDHSRRGETQVELHRLDTVLPGLLAGIDHPRVFLKMDTQGHDLSVFDGATGVLQQILGLQSEVPAVPLYEGMHTLTQMLDYYRAKGFVPIGFFPVNTLRSVGVAPEFDVLLNRFDGDLLKRSE